MKLRKTLKLVLVTGFTTFAALTANAQKAYVKLGGGYNFGVGGPYQNSVFRTIYHDNPENSSISQELIQMNYGKGMTFGGTLGYTLQENLALELGINYLLSNKNEVGTGALHYDSNFPNSPQPRYDLVTNQTYARMFLFQPAVVIKGNSEYLNPYARIGLVAGKGKIHNDYRERKAKDLEQKTELSGGVGFGFQGALGATLKLTETLNLFLEGTFQNLHYAPTKGEITSRTLDGQDNMFMLYENQINFEFTDNLEYDLNNIPHANKPLKSDYTFSSAGLNLGLLISF